MHFYGRYEHSLDGRGRVAIPAVYRRELHDGGVLRPADDGCLELYTHEGFREETARRLGDSGTRRRSDRQRRRDFLPDAFGFTQLDQQGRIVIPQEMREHAGLEGRVTLVGLGDYVEVWDPERWAAARQAAAEAAMEDDE